MPLNKETKPDPGSILNCVAKTTASSHFKQVSGETDIILNKGNNFFFIGLPKRLGLLSL